MPRSCSAAKGGDGDARGALATVGRHVPGAAQRCYILARPGPNEGTGRESVSTQHPVEPIRPEHARRPLGRLEYALRGQPEALIFGGAALVVVALFACDYALPSEIRLHGL